MRDGRPNPDIWGNIITCGEIAVGIYEIVGTKKRGLEVPKALAEEILPESVMEQAAQDGENLCLMMWPMIRPLNLLFQTMSWTGWTWKDRSLQ